MEEDNEEEEIEPITGTMQVTLTAGEAADHLYMLESLRYDTEYENGNDARKFIGGDFNIFAIEGTNQLAVNATSDMAQTRIGVRTGDESAYTLKFTNLQGDRGLLLHDAEMDQDIDIYEGAEYTFFAVPNTQITDRFYIIETEQSGNSGVTTSCENLETATGVSKFIKNGQLYVLKNGLLYNAQGIIVR